MRSLWPSIPWVSLARSRSVHLILELLLIGGGFYFMFRWFEHHQVYQPTRALEASGDSLGRPWQEVRLETGDGERLHGWFFPPTTNPAPSSLVVLLCHGNAGNISHRLVTCETLLQLGVGVLVFDYRGYGQSTGTPSEEGTYRDAEAAYDWLKSNGYESQRIIALGESLGGGVAAELALRHPVRGLILVSTFSSVPAVGAELFPFLPVKSLGTIRYDTASKLPRVHVPVLIMHSREDSIIRFHHSQTLLAAANEPKTLCEVFGDHNDTLFVSRDVFQRGLGQFFASLPSASAP